MISKELFCKTIADIQEQDRKISEFDHALGKICDSAVVFDADNLYLAALLRMRAASRRTDHRRRQCCSTERR